MWSNFSKTELLLQEVLKEKRGKKKATNKILTLKKTKTNSCTGWNDKIVVLKKTTLQLYFKTFIEKINSGNLIML